MYNISNLPTKEQFEGVAEHRILTSMDNSAFCVEIVEAGKKNQKIRLCDRKGKPLVNETFLENPKGLPHWFVCQT
jgi:hypothetical protein